MKKLAIALLLAAACGQNTEKLTELPPGKVHTSTCGLIVLRTTPG